MNPVRRAQALLDLGRPDQAADAAATALAADPDDRDAWCVLAAARLRVSDPAAALEAADAAVACAPETAYPWRLRACALLGLGRTVTAVVAARTAVRLAPESATAHLLLAECLLRVEDLSEDEREEAHACAVRAVACDPENADAHYVQGLAEAALGRRREAVRAQRRALQADPQHALAHRALGRLRLAEGDLYGAAEGFAAAMEADPVSAGAPRGDLERIWLRLFGPFWLISLVCFFVSPSLLRDGGPTAVGDRLVLIGLLLLVWAGYLAAAALRIPTRLRRPALRVLRVSPAARTSVVSASAGSLALLLLLVVPPLDGAVGGWLLGTAVVAAIGGAVLATRHTNARRSRPEPARDRTSGSLTEKDLESRTVAR